jgi:hypothetical protein
MATASPSHLPIDPALLHALEAIDAIVIVAVLVVVVRLQLITRRVRAQNFVGAAIYVGLGLATGVTPNTARGDEFLVMGLIVSAVFGVWRGLATKVWLDSSGTFWRRGGVPVLVIWFLTVAARLGLSYYAQARYSVPIAVGDLWLGFGVTIAVQNVVILMRRPRRA